jgi:hypothetical protein
VENYPSLAEVETIAANRDALIRNLQITQSYYELSAAFERRTGLAANWCTFATWASKQAGQTIRKEDLLRTLERLAQPPAHTSDELELSTDEVSRQVRAHLWDEINPAGAAERASQAVGRGNLMVFAEIGREFSRFMSACLDDTAFDLEKLQRFCEALRPGDPPDGQDYLRQAFSNYYRAFFEADARLRAQLILLANIQIGYHEQTRLQPEIAEALNSGVRDSAPLTRGLFNMLFPFAGWSIRQMAALKSRMGKPVLLEQALKLYVAAARRQVRLAITHFLMTIGLPHGASLHLGSDLHGSYPTGLQVITLEELNALLEQVDPTPGSLRQSAAVDWANLPDRLHFIVELFRRYQEEADLMEPPFTPEQVAALKDGRRPEGRL